MTESGQHDPEPSAATPPAATPPTERPNRERRPVWRTVVDWRNWRLPVKVAAVLAVPAIAAVTLGALQVRGDVLTASADSRTQQLVALRASLIPLATDLQTERLLAAEKLGTSIPVDVPNYYQVNDRVDKDALAVTTLGKQLMDPNTAAGIRFQGLAGQLAGIGALHQQALNGGADVVTVVSTYGTVIGSVLDFDQALSTQLGDPGLTGTATALTDLEVAQEQVRQQQTIVVVGIARGDLLGTELTTLRSSDGLLADRLEDFQVVASPAQLALYQRAPMTTAINNREALAQAVLANGQTLAEVGITGKNGTSLGVTTPAWNTASDAAVTQLAGVQQSLANELRTTSTALRDSAIRAASIEGVVIFVVLLLAVAVGVIVGRHLLRSLGILRRTALEVAEYRLPDVVANIDQGNLNDLEIEPVPVHTREELGQLARAFDAVHGQAVRSAVGQATLRSNLRNIFINLSRRSQSLVERQLRLMEKLERNEEDPQQLANLFRLDHLATRMRRNNENLMVLSGDDPARRSGHPLPLADVLRAAVSEIEQYQRVAVRSTPSVDVLGYASGDLVRLIAELLDNATSFSPPKTQVRIGGQTLPDGAVRIEIRDEGIGMAPAELGQANAKLTATDSDDVPVSRQMGLYVVGRLARRHSIGVTLEVLPDGAGLLAIVRVPAELVKTGSGPMRPSTVAVNGNSVANGTPVNGVNGNGGNGNSHVTSGTLPPFAPPEQWQEFVGATITDTGSISLEPTGFTWFITKGAHFEKPADQPDEPNSTTSVGLPRRVPRSHAVPSLVKREPGRHNATPTRPATDAAQASGTTGTHRSPARARGFLNDYQAGIRQGRPASTSDDEPESAEGDTT